MKKIYLTAIAVILIPFVSKAQWSTTSPNTYFTYTGNVGIGTTTYSALLTVGSASTRGTFNLVGSTADVAAFSISDSRTNGHQFTFYNGASALGNLDLYDQTASAYRFTVNSAGNIGIGTIAPLSGGGNASWLTLNGASTYGGGIISSVGGTAKGYNYYDNATNSMAVQGTTGVDVALQPGNATALIAKANGNVGIGTTNPPTVGNYGVLAINGRSPFQGGYLSLMNNGVEVGSLAANSQLNIGAATGIVTQFNTGGTPTMQITAGGNMLLGKISQANASYLLDVNGKARCNEVVVNTTGADFVFQPGYKLNTLADIEKYVQANHHLPEIPSAQEMVTDGLKVGEMNKLLLMKVEELTLYLIEKDKKEQEQNSINKQQKELLQAQQKQIDELNRKLSILLNQQSK